MLLGKFSLVPSRIDLNFRPIVFMRPEWGESRPVGEENLLLETGDLTAYIWYRIEHIGDQIESLIIQHLRLWKKSVPTEVCILPRRSIWNSVGMNRDSNAMK